VIHAYGIPQVIEDRERLYTMLESLVDTHEAARTPPWRMDLPDDYVDRMLRAIVGFEIPITRLEGKLKLSQNRPEGDRRRVVAELAESNDALSLEVARMMQARK
jgi:transcriptional regulator